uniref:beta-ketoacyl-[acyl-carrier-protein] synthase III n=1 Tax=Pyramimonas obovata TaxID=1411642 RepID=A0A7S0WJX3_9CHLO|mmetsp:Transcript_28075/g.61438  ORF Transcript_28075/g.61438 Transcript_28075/m.61438 type:complete len:422 (+) Transcript_28075:193-1458(+)|eukprot:CAMPEP_0118933668 /NCGR_PEP_ID=MMETSP1169-20130426/12116_1 /TAXON_ID=36882 /ORGANISM="Pyramimonas obovata, Strain CCMP722" /LENGTH=421 /DNA_ID=CAMNT_0006876461 /DNA_START=190 /DNA_END=1455 /DNA_ORIENTATION=-
MASGVTGIATRLHTAGLSNARQESSVMSRRANSAGMMKQSAGRSRRAHRVDCVAGGVSLNRPAAEKGVKFGARLIGTGSAAPPNVLTNKDLEKLVDTNDEWISTRTGIRRRHIIGKDQTLSDLASEAALKALDMAKVDPADVDLIILCTSTADDIFGSACMVQAKIGAKRAAAFDLTAACSGFVVGLVNATHMIRGGNFKNVVVIGADALSRFVDWRDRSTCILFGDGCGAMVLQATEGDCGVLGFDVCSDGTMNQHLVARYTLPQLAPVLVSAHSGEEEAQKDGVKPLCPDCSTQGAFNNISMTGSEIFKFAVRKVPLTVKTALGAAGLEVENIDHLVLHQANQRILDSASERLGVPKEKVVSNIAEYGNTSAASIPLALDEAVRAGKVAQGDVLALAGFGAGLTWASAICRWGNDDGTH